MRKSLLIAEARSSERGSVLIFIALALVAIFGIAALAVDQSRGMMSHTQAESLADTIALSTVKALDGTLAGWNNVELMAKRSLETTALHHVDNETFMATVQ